MGLPIMPSLIARMVSNASVNRWAVRVLALCACGPVIPSIALGQDPQPVLDDPMILMGRAVHQYNEGEYANAVDELDRLLKSNPQDSEARFLRALAHGRLALEHEGRADGTAAAGEYALMRDDIDELLRRELTDRDAILNLISGVVRAKIAGFTGPQRMVERARLLREAEQALRLYLDPPAETWLEPPSGLSRVRGEYFLAVIVYRQALKPAAKEGDPDELADASRLTEAGRLLKALTEETSDKYIDKLLPLDLPDRAVESRRWRSYAHLYLTLVQTRQANRLMSRRANAPALSLIVEAIDSLERSKELDDLPPYGSLSFGRIPKIHEDLIDPLEETRNQLQEAPGAAEDLLIEWRTGFAYDTNVILLGRNTSVPRDIGRKHDVVASTGLGIGYTLDLAKADHRLQGLTLGVLGRSSANWHGAIDEFNEQDYGGSLALQYEVPGTRQAGEREHGPLYATLQYNYDYFLLGNDGFLRSNSVSPRLTLYTHDQHVAWTLAFNYEDRNYLEPLVDNRFDRDGDYFGFSVSSAFDLVDMAEHYKEATWGLSGDPTGGEDPDPDYARWLRSYVGSRYGWDATAGEEFDTDRFGLFAGVEVPVPYGLTFNFRGEWEWEDYSGSNGGSLIDYHRRGREDFVQTYSFGLGRRFVLEPGEPKNRATVKIDRLVMILRADVSLTDDDGNVEDRMGQAIFSYDRTVYGLSVAFQFN